LAGDFAAPEVIERFQRETKDAAALYHPGGVPIYESGECEGRPYFTMPLIEGGSLQERVLTGPLPPRISAQIVKQLVEADETFYLNLAQALNGSLADAQGVGTILNGD